MSGGLSSTTGIVAVAGTAVAALSLIAVIVLAVTVRRLRADQRVVLGDRAEDLVAHAANLDADFENLSRYLQAEADGLVARMTALEEQASHAIAYRALVRYDAYGEMSGRQSTSLVLLDATRSGVVLSSIHHRDQARIYSKLVHRGTPELPLSPEEEEAIATALAGGGPTVSERADGDFGDGDPGGGAPRGVRSVMVMGRRAPAPPDASAQ